MSKPLQPPALDPTSVTPRRGSAYRHPYRAPLDGRIKRALGDALGLEGLGVNLVHLEPGSWSSPRHWHSEEDEFVYVLEGELTLVSEAGETELRPGMAAGFPAGVANGHHLINHGSCTAVYLEIGDRSARDIVHYPDSDLRAHRGPGGRVFTNRKGEPY